MKITKRGIMVEERDGLYVISIITDNMDSFGKIKTTKSFFDEIREYALERTVKQAQNLYPAINC